MSWIERTSAAAALVICNVALADCEMRNWTAKEAEFSKRVAASLKEALRDAPTKWKREALKEEYEDSVCTSSKEGDIQVQVSATYRYQPSKEEEARADAEDRRLKKEIETLDELPPDVKKERQVWLDKMSEANRAGRAAEKAGDKQLAREKSREADGYSDKGRAVRDRYRASVQAKAAALEAQRKAAYPGATLRVTLIANESSISPRHEVGEEKSLIGKQSGRTRGLKIVGITVAAKMDGSEARRREIETVVDREKLQRLVQ